MRLLTKEQARELDRVAIKKMGIPGVDLMGKAGSAVAEYAQNMIAEIHNPKVAIICGKGNNAGDGYKAALELQKVGVSPQIFTLPDKKDIKGDSLFYYKKCAKENITITHSDGPPKRNYDLIIDALLGTGFKGELCKPIIDFTKWINNQNSLVLSIDIPSGVNANNGMIAQNAIIADSTITMGMTKVGMMVDPGKSHCGEIIPVDIGFPDIYDKLPGMKFRTCEQDLAYNYLKAPDVATYKHRQGKVLIIAGSRGMTGAAILASCGAVRSGAGLVTTCAPTSLNNIYESKILEGLTVCCEDGGKGYFTEDNYTVIEKYFDWSDTILIGPGLGKNTSTMKLVKKITSNYEKPIIIDADALSCFNGNMELFNKMKSDFIITPHHGELANLLNINISTIKGKIIDYLQYVIDKIDGTIVVKNAPTIIANKNDVVINTTGNQGLATGGTGDVLSGVIASFTAQGIPAAIAAVLGVFIHGKAADFVAEKKGYRGLIASDLIDVLPQVLMTYE